MRRAQTVAALCCALSWLLVSAAGCGEDGTIILRVTSDLQVPAELDRLEVQVFNQDRSVTRYQTSETAQQMPMEIRITPESNWEERLSAELEGFLESAAVAEADVIFGWEEGMENIAEIQLNPL